MKIYLVCEDIDLGYHVKHAVLLKEVADGLAKEYNDMSKSKGRREDYFVEEIEVGSSYLNTSAIVDSDESKLVINMI